MGEKGSSSCRAVYLAPFRCVTPATFRTGSFSGGRGVWHSDLGDERTDKRRYRRTTAELFTSNYQERRLLAGSSVLFLCLVAVYPGFDGTSDATQNGFQYPATRSCLCHAQSSSNFSKLAKAQFDLCQGLHNMHTKAADSEVRAHRGNVEES